MHARNPIQRSLRAIVFRLVVIVYFSHHTFQRFTCILDLKCLADRTKQDPGGNSVLFFINESVKTCLHNKPQLANVGTNNKCPDRIEQPQQNNSVQRYHTEKYVFSYFIFLFNKVFFSHFLVDNTICMSDYDKERKILC